MNPVGLALAFVFFWLTVGIGLFLVSLAMVRVSRTRPALGIVASNRNRAALRELLVSTVFLIAGGALVYYGVSSSYYVIFR